MRPSILLRKCAELGLGPMRGGNLKPESSHEGGLADQIRTIADHTDRDARILAARIQELTEQVGQLNVRVGWMLDRLEAMTDRMKNGRNEDQMTETVSRWQTLIGPH